MRSRLMTGSSKWCLRMFSLAVCQLIRSESSSQLDADIAVVVSLKRHQQSRRDRSHPIVYRVRIDDKCQDKQERCRDDAVPCDTMPTDGCDTLHQRAGRDLQPAFRALPRVDRVFTVRAKACWFVKMLSHLSSAEIRCRIVLRSSQRVLTPDSWCGSPCATGFPTWHEFIAGAERRTRIPATKP